MILAHIKPGGPFETHSGVGFVRELLQMTRFEKRTHGIDRIKCVRDKDKKTYYLPDNLMVFIPKS